MYQSSGTASRAREQRDARSARSSNANCETNCAINPLPRHLLYVIIGARPRGGIGPLRLRLGWALRRWLRARYGGGHRFTNSGHIRHFLLCSAVLLSCASPGIRAEGAHMRRSWPVLAATIALVFGGVLLAAYPAAAQVGVMGRAAGAARRPIPPAVSQTSRPWRARLPESWHRTPPADGPPSSAAATGPATPRAAGTAPSPAPRPAGRSRPDSAPGGTYAAFWVGLDGYTSNTVEQIGTEVDCAGRTPLYHGWYETYPAGAVNFPEPVRPGDQFSGSVTYRGHDTFQLVLRDVTGSGRRRVASP